MDQGVRSLIRRHVWFTRELRVNAERLIRRESQELREFVGWDSFRSRSLSVAHACDEERDHVTDVSPELGCPFCKPTSIIIWQIDL
ncbi:hypothetical protein [Agromyces sp. Leaf222]|uniref:hypothetical protein n=1 Tax=Agromyces sp. Leaf222 TaxID=1735688 RepID=UPI0006FB74E4|nr:hypothetical protein [Agromyces sp. Leaf222]KQM82406.1 hypothetical protein ASE68_03160 [Agromyces sp. Leaf222]